MQLLSCHSAAILRPRQATQHGCVPALLFTAEREKEPVVVYAFDMAPEKLARLHIKHKQAFRALSSYKTDA